MECYNIWVDIVIPLISAFLGGLVTMIGVICTINHENKCRKNDECKFYKPLFVALNPLDSLNKDFIKVDLESNTEKGMFCLLEGYIKNLDFSHFIIESIVVDSVEYYPVNNALITKDSAIHFVVYGARKDVRLATMHTYDVLGNKYTYNVIFNEKSERGNRVAENYVLSRRRKK